MPLSKEPITITPLTLKVWMELFLSGIPLEEIKATLSEALDVYIEVSKEMGCEIPESYEIHFSMDVKSLLEYYEGIFS